MLNSPEKDLANYHFIGEPLFSLHFTLQKLLQNQTFVCTRYIGGENLGGKGQKPQKISWERTRSRPGAKLAITAINASFKRQLSQTSNYRRDEQTLLFH